MGDIVSKEELEAEVNRLEDKTPYVSLKISYRSVLVTINTKTFCCDLVDDDGEVEASHDWILRIFSKVFTCLCPRITFDLSDNSGLTDENYCTLYAEVLKNASSVRESVDIINVDEETYPNLRIIVQALEGSGSIRRLRIESLEVEGAMQFVLEKLRPNSSLETLVFDNCEIKGELIVALNDFLRKNSSLECLYIDERGGPSITVEEAGVLIKTLESVNCGLTAFIYGEPFGFHDPVLQPQLDRIDELCESNARLQKYVERVMERKDSENTTSMPWVALPEALEVVSSKPDHLYKLLRNHDDWLDKFGTCPLRRSKRKYNQLLRRSRA